MEINNSNYFTHPFVSNSDLSWLDEELKARENRPDPTEAYKFGTLIDCMITEPHEVDYFKRTCMGQEYTPEQFEMAEKMKASFYRDPLCTNMVKNSEYQTIFEQENKTFNNGLAVFTLSVKCKFDLWMPVFNWGGDIKSTTATTQKQFEAAIEHFNYDRQRAWYMDIAGSDKDILIGISKKNFKVFKVPITRGDARYNRGREKYEYLTYKWFQLFGDMSSLEVKKVA